MTYIPVGAMYLHARTFCALTDTTVIPAGEKYLHARMFCTLTDMTFIAGGRSGKNTHISMISNSVTHLRSYTKEDLCIEEQERGKILH